MKTFASTLGVCYITFTLQVEEAQLHLALPTQLQCSLLVQSAPLFNVPG